MSSIWFCGDTHGEFRPLIKQVLEQRPSAIVLLGDLQPQRPLHEELAPILDATEVWFIHGNHDTDSAQDCRHVWESSLADRNLDGRVVTIAGVRVAGLGGVFRETVWHPEVGEHLRSVQDLQRAVASRHDPVVRETFLRTHRSSILPQTYEALARERADVLVTHEAPSCHPRGFEAIDLLAAALGVKTSFHGHHHDCLDYASFRATLGFMPRGVGLRGITALDGTQILAGELDAQRAMRLAGTGEG